jgi:hypothetical protein
MAKRIVFIPSSEANEFVTQKEIDFKWHSGLAVSQKQKSIRSLHEESKKKLNINKVLEISSKSEDEIGKLSSAFNLNLLWKNKTSTIESFYQGSKVFANGGPFTDLYEKESITAKKDIRIKNSGDLIGFSFFNQNWSLEDDFYTWLYLMALSQNQRILEKLTNYDAFTDIEFNHEKSFNCQAYSAAFYVSFVKYKEKDLENIKLPTNFKRISPQKIIKNFQSSLF